MERERERACVCARCLVEGENALGGSSYVLRLNRKNRSPLFVEKRRVAKMDVKSVVCEFIFLRGERRKLFVSFSFARSLMTPPPPLGAGAEGYGGGAFGVSGARAATAGESDSRDGRGGDGVGAGGIADDGRGRKEGARFASVSASAAAADPHGRGFWDHSSVAELYRVLQQRSQRQGVSF